MPSTSQCAKTNSLYSLQAAQFDGVVFYVGFRLQAGERKPLEGGLSAVSLLGLFNLSNACSFVFADRFVRLFWQHRTQDRGIEIGFEEFVRLLSIWTRGEKHVSVAVTGIMSNLQASGCSVAVNIAKGASKEGL